jgi:predicted phage terminase large subunit-like protein
MVTDGLLSRLMIFVPPRHGKSEMVTVRYPVYRLECDPAMRVIVGAYNQTLANTFSRKSRRIAQARLDLSGERLAVEQWDTAAGGGLRAVGVGGGVTGQGGNLIVIDDPVKNREEAESETYRNRTYDWYTDDLYTRLEPGAAMILIMTRWHEDDLAGRILASEDGPNWTVINLPAIARENDPLGRQVGEALCPERYDVAALEERRRVLGEYAYSALFDGSPQPAEGGLIKREWLAKTLEVMPAGGSFLRYWDKAGTEGAGCFTAGVLMARYPDGRYIVVDVMRGQWSSKQREDIILETAKADRARWKCNTVWVEQEPGSGGKESAEATVRNLAGFDVHKETVTGDKTTRLRPFAAQCEAGNVILSQGDWHAAYIAELTALPFGRYRDQGDATSGAFNKLADMPATYGYSY